jgi:hypothetical protein
MSEAFHAKMKKVGAPSALIPVPWEDHVFDFGVNSLGGQIRTYAEERFIAAVLPLDPV